MSSRLITGSEAAVWEAMPWSISGSPSARRTNPPGPPAVKAQVAARTPEPDTSKLEREIANAKAAALAEGEAKGRQQAQAELQSVLQKLAAAIHETAELRGRLRQQAEGDLVRLSIAIARKILGRELTADPEAIAGIVKAGLERLRVQDVLRVRMHPELKSHVAECLSRQGAAHAELIGDPAFERGAVVFETSRGNLDSSVETQLREIERGLTDRFSGRA